jgi:hypothetical protein
MQSVLANLIFLILEGYGPVELLVTALVAVASWVALHFKITSGGGVGVLSEELLESELLLDSGLLVFDDVHSVFGINACKPFVVTPPVPA